MTIASLRVTIKLCFWILNIPQLLSPNEGFSRNMIILVPCKPLVAKWMSMGWDQKAKSSVKGWSTWVWPSLNPANTFHAPPTGIQFRTLNQLHRKKYFQTAITAAASSTLISPPGPSKTGNTQACWCNGSRAGLATQRSDYQPSRQPPQLRCCLSEKRGWHA